MAVSVQQAAVNALQVWLASRLPGVTVRAQWPDSDAPLPAKSVTILMAGDPEDEQIEPDYELVPATPIHFTASAASSTLTSAAHGLPNGTPVTVSSTVTLPGPLKAETAYFVRDATASTFALAATLAGAAIVMANAGSGVHSVSRVAQTYRWSVKARRQALQLDVWCVVQYDREQLLGLLDQELNRGEALTLGIANGDPTRDGLLLALDPADGHTGFADFTFGGTKPIDTTESVKQSEFRALIRGEAVMELCIEAESPRLLRAKLLEHLSTGTDTYAISATGFSHTFTP